jgi:phage shock protein PspC (stress-responsive transcriptional regulator)
MNKVVTIHLDGIAYSLEESAYDALRTYLDGAKATLSQNPDKDEIIKDLEQAIGAKLNAYLNAHKNVVTKSDVDAVLVEMGPVAAEGEGTSDEGGAGKTTNAAFAHKHLYRIPQGEWIAGVCTGLAAYFNIDVSLIRVLFVLLTILTHGLGALVYLFMMFVVPVAHTSKDYENASGIPPVTAQELVDRARKGIEDFANSGEWKSWKDSLNRGFNTSHDAHRAWKQQRKAWKRAQRREWKQYQYNQPQSFLSELNGFIWSMFGLLIMLFGLWYLYHHVHLVQQFIDFIHTTWDSFFYALSKVLGNK